MLGELDGRVAVDDEEVDVLAGIRLAVSAGGFVARLAAECIAASLRRSLLKRRHCARACTLL